MTRVELRDYYVKSGKLLTSTQKKKTHQVRHMLIAQKLKSFKKSE